MLTLRREKYLSRIRPFYHDADVIKVMTGVRRCGKSTMMRQIMEEISESLPADGAVAYIDLDSREHMGIRTVRALEERIDGLLPEGTGPRYLFIDEVQNVEGFEQLVNAYRGEGVSVFVTGSNSYLLSGELVTKLTGRYVEFGIMPFSLSEIREFKQLNGMGFDARRELEDYLVNGGFPGRFFLGDGDSQAEYVRSVVREIVEKDILMRNRVRGRGSFKRILAYVLSTPSATVSSTSVSDYLRSDHVDILPSTVNRYLALIFDSKLASRCMRVDLVGRKALKTLYKSYLADPALHSYGAGPRTEIRIGMMLENIVHNELVSRGYNVAVGKQGDKEVDFVVSKGRRVAYVQVAYVLGTPETERREEAPLLAIRDAFPKYIISLDPLTISRNGITRLNLLEDFLLGDGFSL